MTLEDHFSSIDQPGVLSVTSDNQLNRDTGLDSELLRLVREDPFASIREMMHDVRRRSEFRRVGWWQVFKVLRSHRLLSKRRRFRFMRGR